MDILIVAHKQEIEELKRKQKQGIETIKEQNERTSDAIYKKQQLMETVLMHLIRKSMYSSQETASQPNANKY